MEENIEQPESDASDFPSGRYDPEEMSSKEWLRHCVEVAETIPMDMADKPNYHSSRQDPML